LVACAFPARARHPRVEVRGVELLLDAFGVSFCAARVLDEFIGGAGFRCPEVETRHGFIKKRFRLLEGDVGGLTHRAP
jgi:hypothetical protein